MITESTATAMLENLFKLRAKVWLVEVAASNRARCVALPDIVVEVSALTEDHVRGMLKLGVSSVSTHFIPAIKSINSFGVSVGFCPAGEWLASSTVLQAGAIRLRPDGLVCGAFTTAGSDGWVMSGMLDAFAAWLNENVRVVWG